jgi:hypothetical protein
MTTVLPEYVWYSTARTGRGDTLLGLRSIESDITELQSLTLAQLEFGELGSPRMSFRPLSGA